ncbi:MAG: histidine phosphatase family protein [Helicobacteraceae bacterium]|nr:histidine phosphatase family protein [Helicobacteraceae bacterium]
MTLTLVRHAEVEEKFQGCYNGHNDIALSEKGVEDAKKLAKTIAKNSYDHIYCSDLIRARNTIKEFNLEQDVTYLKGLREKSWGVHEGKSFDEISKEIKYKNFTQWITSLDGEDPQKFYDRITSFLNLLKMLKYENVLIVTHSGVIKAIDSIVNRVELEKAFSKKVPYCSITKLSL